MRNVRDWEVLYELGLHPIEPDPSLLNQGVRYGGAG